MLWSTNKIPHLHLNLVQPQNHMHRISLDFFCLFSYQKARDFFRVGNSAGIVSSEYDLMQPLLVSFRFIMVVVFKGMKKAREAG